MRLLSLLLFSSLLYGDMTKEDIVKESLYQALIYVDYRQTKEILKDPYRQELNPIINDENVERYFIIGGLLHASISYFLPREYRAMFQDFTLAFGVFNVSWNYSVGVRF